MVVIEGVSREDAIERILTYLSLSEHCEQGPEDEVVNWDYLASDVQKVFADFQRLSLRHFDGAQPFAYLSLMFLAESYTRYVWEPTDPELHRLPLPGWQSIMLGIDENAKQISERWGHPYMYSLQKMRAVPLKEVRGLFRPLSGNIIERSVADIFSDGKYRTERVYLELRGDRWYEVGAPMAVDPVALSDKDNDSVWCHKSLALTTEYDWQVQLAYNYSDLPSISLVTDPLGSKDIFKLRDVPKGKSRRDALRNWVAGHWRRGSTPESPETHIWPFLRGAEEFTWNGLYCKIQPSAYDLRKAKEYQEQAAKQKARKS